MYLARPTEDLGRDSTLVYFSKLAFVPTSWKGRGRNRHTGEEESGGKGRGII